MHGEAEDKMLHMNVSDGECGLCPDRDKQEIPSPNQSAATLMFHGEPIVRSEQEQLLHQIEEYVM